VHVDTRDAQALQLGRHASRPRALG
jgi:hypothetical protein